MHGDWKAKGVKVLKLEQATCYLLMDVAVQAVQ